jgi:potassium uptake TrkH family protein
MARRDRLSLARLHPAQTVTAGFAVAVAVGTGLLSLPAASAGEDTTLLQALFTATSAVCVTGLVVVDTATHWSLTGQVIILGLIQVGGFGIMTLASLLGLLVSRRLGLRTRLTTAAETKSLGLGDIRTVVLGVAAVSLVVETVIAVVLTLRLMTAYDEPPARAAWLGVFHSVSAFNNAGFALYSDSLIRFVTDAWVCLPIALAVIVGGIGFPVLFELRRTWRRPSRFSLHTKLTLLGTAILLPLGTVFMLVAEWSNPRTLGALDVPGRLLAGFFQGVMPRTAGFNSLDTAAMNTGTWLGTDILMFIGGGSGGTAGGIKIATVAVLVTVVISEIRGEADPVAFGRRLPSSAQRQAVTVSLLGVVAIAVSATWFAMTTPFTLDQVLFELVSAFATVGLSTGITAQLPVPHQYALVALMFVGRLGPITFATAIALRQNRRLFRYPEERPVIG